jgi:photosystem II PsbU protein
MRSIVAVISLVITQAAAFIPSVATKIHVTTVTTELSVHPSRRDFLFVGIATATFTPLIANAASSTFFYDQKIETVIEPSQMATNGKIDLNSAQVGDYKYLKGFFPHAAGKIASHGPYKSVSDIYKIPSLTKNDMRLFHENEKYFTVNPPGRAFDERINSRVST